MSDPNPPYIVSLGDIAADILVDIPGLPVSAGELVIASQMGFEPGGSANFMIAASRLGMQTKAVGVLGADFWGDQLAEILQAEGVDLTCLTRSGTTTLAVVLVGSENQHAFVGMFGEGQSAAVDAELVRLVAESAGLYVTGYALNETRLSELAFELMGSASRAGVTVFLDTGPSFSRLSHQIQEKALKFAAVLLTTSEEMPSMKPAELLDWGISMVVEKAGPAGCVLHLPGTSLPISGHPVEVVDVTAAGDSFDAGFVVATTRGLSPAAAARFANAVGAAKVQKFGSGRNVPTLAEVEQVLDQFEVNLD